MSWTFDPSMPRARTVESLFGGMPNPDAGVGGPRRAAGSPDYYPALHDVSAIANPTSILELGVGLGYGGVTLVAGSGRCARYVGIDNESSTPGSNALALANIQYSAPTVDVTIVAGDTSEGLPEEVGSRKYSLVYVDAGPDPSQGIRIAWSVLSAGGSLLVDDIHVGGVGRESTAKTLPSLRGVNAVVEVFTGAGDIPRGLLWVTKKGGRAAK